MADALPRTLGELRSRGYRPQSVKAEMRKNLLERLAQREPLVPGIVGYEETVIPQVENAIRSQHDVLRLRRSARGKTRMLRQRVNGLDEAIPGIAGCEGGQRQY